MKISVTETLEALFLQDCTGLFSGENKGGYGIPNERLEDMTDSYIDVQPPSATTKYPFRINTFKDGYPAKDAFGYEILPYMVGSTNNEFESGEWKFKQTVVFTKGTKVTTKTAYLSEILIKSIECCVDKATKGKLQGGDIFSDPKKKLVIELSNLLEDSLRNKKCGQTESAKKTIDLLKEHCNCCGCL